MRRSSWALVAVLGLVGTGCGHTGDAIDCQLQNHSREWFDGSDYHTCMSRQAQDRRALAQHERNQEACLHGNAQACYDAGVRDLGLHDRLALRELDAACRADIGGACWQAGSLLRGEWLSPDRPRAVTLLSRACVLGVAQGCAEAAELHPDPAARAGFAERACMLGARAACAKAGDARMASDRTQARELYELGCNAGQHDACVGLGRLQAVAP